MTTPSNSDTIKIPTTTTGKKVRKQNREAERSYEDNYERTGHGEYHRRDKYPQKWDLVRPEDYSDDDYYDDEQE